MIKILKRIRLILEFFRFFPHLILFYTHKNKSFIEADTIRWISILKIDLNKAIGFIYLLCYHPEFRNLFYYRVGYLGHILNLFSPKMSTLHIDTKYIGGGLFIQHGFASTIGAKYIGKNCWVNQQVTIGYSNDTDLPVIMDNVTINAGAIVIGKVVIGENSRIGANAVVVKDIPENCSVFCPPPYIMKWDATKSKEQK
jgi:serine O-acetyltransferase